MCSFSNWDLAGWVRWIKFCISIVRLSILVNGTPVWFCRVVGGFNNYTFYLSFFNFFIFLFWQWMSWIASPWGLRRWFHQELLNGDREAKHWRYLPCYWIIHTIILQYALWAAVSYMHSALNFMIQSGLKIDLNNLNFRITLLKVLSQACPFVICHPSFFLLQPATN